MWKKTSRQNNFIIFNTNYQVSLSNSSVGLQIQEQENRAVILKFITNLIKFKILNCYITLKSTTSIIIAEDLLPEERKYRKIFVY